MISLHVSSHDHILRHHTSYNNNIIHLTLDCMLVEFNSMLISLHSHTPSQLSCSHAHTYRMYTIILIHAVLTARNNNYFTNTVHMLTVHINMLTGPTVPSCIDPNTVHMLTQFIIQGLWYPRPCALILTLFTCSLCLQDLW